MKLYVGTRKGLFRFEQQAGRWRQSGQWFLGVAIPSLLRDARDNTLYVAVEHGHFGTRLHRAHDAQAPDWEELDAPRYPRKPDGAPDTLCPVRKIPVPWSLQKIWCLEPDGSDRPGALWCGTIPGGLFRSEDRGESWDLNRSLWDRPERAKWYGGGYDYPGIHSIEVHPNDPDDVIVGISCGGIWRSRDGGRDWSQCAQGMYFDFNPDEREDDPDTQDPHRVVRCASDPERMWSQHHCGIFRRDRDSNGWQRIEPVTPSDFGFATAVHPSDPDTAWFVPAVKDELRYPVDARLVVTRTTDGGRHFEVLDQGLPGDDAYDLIYRHGLTVDDRGNRLAMGSTTGSLWIGDDGGEQWSLLTTHLPPIYCLRFA